MSNSSDPLRIFFVAGESSGDLHGGNLIRAIRARRSDVVCEGIGGSRMRDAGMDLRHDLAATAIMGFVEVVRHFGAIRALFNETVDRLRETRPHCLVLIDYPGFNIRLAKEAHALGIPVVYYISPQIWAWKKGRIKTMARVCKRVLTVFPFEKKLYDDAGIDCVYVGHPLIDHIEKDTTPPISDEDFVVGLMPGSREQEIGRIFPVMAETARRLKKEMPEARFIVPCVDAAREAQVRSLAGGLDVETVVGNTYGLLKCARGCLVASGTATVETAIFGVPMAILYKVNPATYWMARAVVDIEYIGMVNILAGRGIVPEFIQHQATPESILPTFLQLLQDTPARNQMIDDLNEVREILGGPGASDRAAEAILETVGHG